MFFISSSECQTICNVILRSCILCHFCIVFLLIVHYGYSLFTRIFYPSKPKMDVVLGLFCLITHQNMSEQGIPKHPQQFLLLTRKIVHLIVLISHICHVFYSSFFSWVPCFCIHLFIMNGAFVCLSCFRSLSAREMTTLLSLSLMRVSLPLFPHSMTIKPFLPSLFMN